MKKKKMLYLIVFVTIIIYIVNPPVDLYFNIIMMLGYQLINIFIQINIHEFGHLLMGKLFGYELMIFYLGPFHFEKHNHKFKFKLVFDLTSYGGLCGMNVKDTSRVKNIFYFSGGILMNFIATLIYFLLYLKTNNPFLANYVYMPSILVGLVLIINNAYPHVVNNMYTDGMLVKSFIKKDSLCDMVVKVLNINMAIYNKRPAELDFTELPSKEINQYYLTYRLYEYYHYLDLGNFAKAKSCMKEIIVNKKQLNSLYYSSMIQEFIYYYSVLEVNLRLAKKYFQESNILHEEKDMSICRILSAYYSNFDYDKALELNKEAYKYKTDYDLQTFVFMEERLLFNLQKVITSKKRIQDYENKIILNKDKVFIKETAAYILQLQDLPETFSTMETDVYQSINYKGQIIRIKTELSLQKRYEKMLYELVKESVDYIKKIDNKKIDTAIVLGSGLGEGITLENPIEINYKDIPNFPHGQVLGHAHKMIIGDLGNRHIACLYGRYHYYEGLSMKEVTYPIYVLKMLQVKDIILTNACGGINQNFKPGDIVAINDFINGVSVNPLIGKNDARFGKRFPDMTEPFSLQKIEELKTIANDLAISLKEGVYTFFQGPYYESKAEINMYKILGSDIIGMSTVPEVIVSNYLGLEVLALGVVTNMATGISDHHHSHQEVLEVAKTASTNLSKLLMTYLKSSIDK